MTQPTRPSPTDRRLSLLTPSARLTLGNYLGAVRQMVTAQDEATCFYGISDLHAMTTPHDPTKLRVLTREFQTRCCWRVASIPSGPRSSIRAGCRPTPPWPTCSSARPTPESWAG